MEPRDLAGAAAAASGIGLAGALVLRAGPVPLEISVVEQAATIARRLDARLEVEVAAALRDPEAEAAVIMRAIEGLEVAALRIGPARDFVSHGPGAWPEHERPLGELLTALRRAGAAGTIGAGTPSFFPEFNRNPPPPGADFVYFGLAANVHAADDRSVAETLSVHPAIIESARHLCRGVPIRLGPVTIGMPHTPYGSGPAPNPERRRIPAARVDPRQDGVFAAAFALAAVVQASRAGVESLCLAAQVGDFGLLDRQLQPRPILHLHHALAPLGGAPCIPGPSDGCYHLVLPTVGISYSANLSAEPVVREIPVRLLSSRGWEEQEATTLPAYGVARASLLR